MQLLSRDRTQRQVTPTHGVAVGLVSAAAVIGGLAFGVWQVTAAGNAVVVAPAAVLLCLIATTAVLTWATMRLEQRTKRLAPHVSRPPRAVLPMWPSESPHIPGEGVSFHVAFAHGGRLIHSYTREGAALGFVRDVVRLRSHEDAAQFELRMVLDGTRTTTLAQGEQLVRRALEDRVL